MKKRSIISILTASALVLGTVSIPVFADNTDPCLIFAEDFESIAEGTKLSTARTSSAWEVIESTAGDSVTVEKDPTTGSKAVKITQTKQTPAWKSNPITGFFVNFTPASEGKTTIKFKMREEVNSANLNDKLFFVKTYEDSAFGYYQILNNLYKKDWSQFGVIGKDTYTDFTVTMDAATLKYVVKTPGYEQEFQANGLTDQLRFAICANYYDGAADWIGSDTGDPIYWIDDIEITRSAVEVEGISPSAGSVVDAGDRIITVDFNCDVDLMNLTSDYVKVFEDGIEIEDVDIMKDFEDSTKVMLTLPDGFKSGSKYTVSVLKGIASSSGGLAPMLADKKVSFKCLNESILFDEDFEEIDEGANLADAMDATTWEVKVPNAGDKVTVEKDPITGSKAVKITQKKQTPAKNSNLETGFFFNFSPVKDGITDVSFKVRQEVNSALFTNKMFMKSDEGTAFNFNPIANGLFTTGTFEVIAEFSKNSYTPINISYDSDTYKYVITSGSNKKEISSDKLMDQLRFTISANYYDGADSWIGSDEGDPIYWIDDIKVSKRCVAVSDVALKGDKLTVTFNTPVAAASAVAANFAVQLDDVDAEGFTVAQDADDASKVIVTLPEIPEYDTVIKLTAKKGIAAVDTLYGDSVEDTVKSFTVEAETSILSENFNSYSSSAVDSKHSDWSVTTSGTGTVTVDTDSLTGSKAIKIVAEKENMSKTGIQIPFTKVTDGKVKVSFKLRDENDSLLFTNLSLNSGYSKQIEAIKCSGTVYDYVGKWYESEYINMDGQYHDVNYILDFNTNTYSIVVDGVIKIKNRTLREPAGTGVDSLNVYVSANYNEFGADESWLPSKTGDGIYWIDDINVVKFNYPTIYSETVTNGASNVPVNSELKYTFDMDMNADSINKDNIKIYADNILVEDYSVSYADKVATVAVAGGLAYDTTYTVVVDSAVKSALMERMKKTVTYTFTTAENPEKFLSMQAVSLNDAPVEDISEFAGESIKVNATLNKNLSGYTFYAAIKDANGRLLSVSKVSSEDVSGTTATVTLSVPTGVTDTSVIEGFLFDTASQAPLSKKKTIKKPLTNTVYVDATKTNGDGSISSPFSSIEEARGYAREYHNSSDERVSIVLREGTFDIPSGLELTALDSNTTYRSFGNEEVTLRGGKTLKVSEMSVAEDSRIKATAAGKVLKVNLTQKGIAAPALGITGHSSYYTKLEGYGGGDVDSSVYADGEMLTPARYPNDGYMTIESVTVNGDFTNKQGMSFTTSDSEYSNWQNATDAYVCGYWYYDWSNLTTPVSTISGNTITTTIPSPYGLRSGQRFYIYHLLEELDAPGEWFYDKSTGDFYIYPPENSAEITICSEVKDILKLTTANSVNIYGLNIECSGRNGISVNESKYVILSGCDIKGASVNGVSVGGSDNLVENCVISAVGETGVGIGGGDTTTLTPSRNTVKNCVVSDCARLVKTYAPNIRLNGVGSTAIGNIISGNPHCAVVFSGNDHKILNNDISNVVYEVSDMGAIYAGGSGITRGNIISGNSFRNLHSNSTHTSEHNIYGVYLDDCFASAEITGNTFENIDGSGVFVNGGRDNVVTNNSFSDIKVDGIKLSTAGTTDWYGDDESFISGLNYNSSLVTSKPYQKYPHLADILDDDYRYPKYNVITGNTFNNCANNIKLDIYNSTLSESDVRAMNTIQ